MKLRIIKREQAKRDLDNCALFISEDSLDSAIRFLDAANESFKGLAQMRFKGIQYQEAIDPNLKAMRRMAIKGFEKYLIFYLPIENGVEIVRVIHGSRDIGAIFNF